MAQNSIYFLIIVTNSFLRSGFSFRRYKNGLEASQFYSPADLEELKNDKLREVIKIVYDGVPFYRKMFKERNLFPEDIKTIDDLEKLPIIDKYTVKENFKDFRNKNFWGFSLKADSSGTTGTPTTYLRDLTSINFENAALWRFFGWGGKVSDTPRATIRGAKIIPIENKTPPFWKYDSFSKELLLSGYHMSDETLPLYIKRIREFSPYDLYSQPSTAYLLAEYCDRKKINLNFSAVFTSSEMVLDHQKKMIEKVFNCKLFDWYGLVERVSAIGQCCKGSYHIQEDYSITEIKPIANGLNEIVGTTLYNKVMPLIRYKTGDLIELNKNEQCECNQNFRLVKKIHGRELDAIRTPDGMIMRLLDHIPRGVNHLNELQFVQHKLDEVTLRIVCTNQFSSSDENKLIQNAREHISKDINFTIEKVSAIERSNRGKFISVICKLEIK